MQIKYLNTMIKKYSSLIILIGGILFAQTNDLQKNKISNYPKSIEESNTKAIIKANIIDGYLQEYYTKTFYNPNGYITKREFYNDSGDLTFTESFSYTKNNILEKIEGTNPDENFIIIKDYEYSPNEYREITSENEIIVKEIIYQLNDNQDIITEKEINYTGDNQTILKTNDYQGKNRIKTTVNYGKEGYLIYYKYDKSNLPIEEAIYDLKNKLVSKKRRIFDEKENLIEENLYDNNGRLKTNSRIIYQYDENGNWNKRTQYANTIEQPISNTIRTIKY